MSPRHLSPFTGLVSGCGDDHCITIYHFITHRTSISRWENSMKDEISQPKRASECRQKLEIRINLNCFCLIWKPLIKPWLFTKLMWFWLQLVLLCIQFQSWRTENLTLRPEWIDLSNLIWLRSPSYDRNYRKQWAALYYGEVWCINQELRSGNCDLSTIDKVHHTSSPPVKYWNIYHSLKPNAMH